jgi:hypothetical protein
MEQVQSEEWRETPGHLHDLTEYRRFQHRDPELDQEE